MDRRTFIALLVPATSAAANGTARVPTLREALKITDWAATGAPTLLVIADLDQPLQLDPPPPGGYTLTDVADAAGCVVMRFGTIATLMPVVEKTLAEPRIRARGALTPGSILPLLNAIDDATLKKLLSEAGLGRSELPENLRNHFNGALPDPLSIARGLELPAFMTLRGNQRDSVRLRLSLGMTLKAIRNVEHIATLVYQGKLYPPGASTPPGALYLLSPPNKPAPFLAMFHQPPFLPRGQQLQLGLISEKTLNQISVPEMKNEPVSLFTVRNLGGLVARLEGVQGGELLVAPELAQQSLACYGTFAANASDIARVILVSTDATFRHVGRRYLLTSAPMPMAPALESLRKLAEEEVPGGAPRREFLPLEWGRFPVTHPTPLPLPWLERLADADPRTGITIPVQEFPLPKMLEKLLAPHRALKPDFAPTHLQIQSSWEAEVLVPNVGAVPLNQTFPLARKRPVVRRALSLKDAWPILRIQTPREAEGAMIWARQQGALGVVFDSRDGAIFTARGMDILPVRRVHRLWKAEQQDPEELRDRTLAGRTTNWLSPTNPEAQALAARRFQMALLPKPHGVLLLDMAPPGYRGRGNDADGTTHHGYTDQNRQFFLSKHQQDIFDIPASAFVSASMDYPPWVYPYAEEKWQEWRQDRLWDFLTELHLPRTVYLEGGLAATPATQKRPGFPHPRWLIPWPDLKSSREFWQPSYNATDKLIGNANRTGSNPWLLVSLPYGATKEALENYLGNLEFEAGDGWQGRYIDLSAYSFDEARGLIS